MRGGTVRVRGAEGECGGKGDAGEEETGDDEAREQMRAAGWRDERGDLQRGRPD